MFNNRSCPLARDDGVWGGGKRLSVLIFKFGRNENELWASHAGRFTPTYPRFPLKRKMEGRSGKEKKNCRESKLDILFVLPAACSV